MARGTGSSLGRALINAIADAAGGTIGVRKSYTRTGWHAQISKLTSSPRGYQAAASVGLSANERTLRDWLAERREPNAANQKLIDKAYRLMAGRWPAEIESRQAEIHGLVKIGSDERERGGSSGRAALVVDCSVGDWTRLKQAWEGGDIDEEDFEEAFIEDLLEADLGDSSEPWEFPGSSYTVVIG